MTPGAGRRISLDGKTVLVTGAAGGLGRALAEALQAKGARLALLDLHADAAEAVAASIPGARGYGADVRDLTSVERAVTGVVRDFGGIDVTVANAGLGSMAPVETISPDVWEAVVDVDLNGVFRTYRATLPYVRERQGYLLGVSSMAAFVHSPLQAPYTAAKAGVLALTNSLRLELRGTGTRCGTLHPTFFASPLMDMVDGDPAGRLVWGGNSGLLWGYVDRAEVVAAAVRGIERRSRHIVVPRRLTGVALAPNLLLPVVERLGFRTKDVKAALATADASKVSQPATVPAGVAIPDGAPNPSR
jgi:NAD(P)-dependent dehydrogenase (short-subunit alcohol dehydrogenase family)